MKEKTIPQFKPISDFKAVRDITEGSLCNAKTLFTDLLKSKERPHILDMESIKRTIKLYKSEIELHCHIRQQIQLWIKEATLNKNTDPNFYQDLLNLEKSQKEYEELIEEIVTFASGVERNDPSQISPERKKELTEKITAIKTEGFSLPPNISQRKTLLREGIYAYVFSHSELGDLGRITITPHQNGQCQFNSEVVGDADDPMTKKRHEIFEPLAKEIMDKTAGVLGNGTGKKIEPHYKPEQHQIANTVFPCEKCGALTAMCVLDEWATTKAELENIARLTYSKVEELQVPTWILGYEKEITIDGEKMGESLTMKVWPQKEEPKIITSKVLNETIDNLMNSHC